jgi:hypothetical protein
MFIFKYSISFPLARSPASGGMAFNLSEFPKNTLLKDVLISLTSGIIAAHLRAHVTKEILKIIVDID